MSLPLFQTEEFFSEYEHSSKYMLCASDCETITIKELIDMGGGSVDKFLETRLGYPQMKGSPQLRESLSKLYDNVSAENIMVLGSPIEGIYLTMRSLLTKDDEAIILTPAYDALLNVPDHLSESIQLWRLKESDNGWALDFEALEKLASDKTKLLVVNMPHNPTGFCPTADEAAQIIEFCKSRGIYLFSDEMYRGLELSDEYKIKSFADSYDKCISLRGFSKTVGMAGLRFGWLTVPDKELYQKIFDWKSYTSMCATMANEYLGVMAVNAHEKLADKNRKLIQSNLEVARQFFDKHKDKFTWTEPKGSSISVFKLHEGNAKDFCHKLAKEHSIVLLPTQFMRSSEDYIRIGLGRANFAQCIEQFDAVLSRQ